MRNARIWFVKDGPAKYISHLDLNKCMLRAIHKAKISIWHTEGFSPHPFITFALPLSLGFKGENEIMDLKLMDDIGNDTIKDKLNAALPHGLQVTNITEPVMHVKEIAFALFRIKVDFENNSSNKLQSLLGKNEILVEKKGKKGIKTINIKEDIVKYEFNNTDNECILNIVLPAGSQKNINPNLILTAFEACFGQKLYAEITRINLYNTNMEIFC